MRTYTEKELEDMLNWYTSSLLGHHDKGKAAEKDIPELIQYIKILKRIIKAFS